MLVPYIGPTLRYRPWGWICTPCFAFLGTCLGARANYPPNRTGPFVVKPLFQHRSQWPKGRRKEAQKAETIAKMLPIASTALAFSWDPRRGLQVLGARISPEAPLRLPGGSLEAPRRSQPSQRSPATSWTCLPDRTCTYAVLLLKIASSKKLLFLPPNKDYEVSAPVHASRSAVADYCPPINMRRLGLGGVVAERIGYHPLAITNPSF